MRELVAATSFLLALVLIGLLSIAVLTDVHHSYEYRQPVTECVDGTVQQWDGNRWWPVYIRKTKRPVPCGN